MEFNIQTIKVTGLSASVKAAGNAMRTQMDLDYDTITEQDLSRGVRLGTTHLGEGHDNFLNGITVHFNIWAPLFMWKQIQRYHFIDFISSQSTMHKLTSFPIREQCVSDVDSEILDRYQELLNEYETEQSAGNTEVALATWRKLIASLPSGFVLGATMVTNYRQLKTIYFQRRYHKLKEWHLFCSWCESLPHFKEFCIGDK